MQSLSDLGEFKLLNEIVLPLLNKNQEGINIGDDCSFFKLPNDSGTLVFTSDVGPTPLVWQLGYESFHSFGWYSIAVNISDLAAVGAKPMCVLSSIEAPNNFAVDKFKKLFQGIADATKELNVQNAGGNIRTAPRLECHVAAIGYLESGIEQIKRDKCKAGDRIIVLGDLGLFPSIYIKAKNKGFSSLEEWEQKILCYPRTQIKGMQRLAKLNLVNAATDNSDSLTGSFWNIIEKSKCKIEIDMEDNGILPNHVLDVADKYNYNPWNIALMWGDWNIVLSIDEKKFPQFKKVAKSNNLKFHEIGIAKKGKPELIGKMKEGKKEMKILRNENFKLSSYNSSIEDHIEYLLQTELFK